MPVALTKDAEKVLSHILRVYIAASKQPDKHPMPQLISSEEDLSKVRGDLSGPLFFRACGELSSAGKISCVCASGSVYSITLCDLTIAEYEHRFRSALASLGKLPATLVSLTELATLFPDILEAITASQAANP